MINNEIKQWQLRNRYNTNSCCRHGFQLFTLYNKSKESKLDRRNRSQSEDRKELRLTLPVLDYFGFQHRCISETKVQPRFQGFSARKALGARLHQRGLRDVNSNTRILSLCPNQIFKFQNLSSRTMCVTPSSKVSVICAPYKRSFNPTSSKLLFSIP